MEPYLSLAGSLTSANTIFITSGRPWGLSLGNATLSSRFTRTTAPIYKILVHEGQRRAKDGNPRPQETAEGHTKNIFDEGGLWEIEDEV